MTSGFFESINLLNFNERKMFHFPITYQNLKKKSNDDEEKCFTFLSIMKLS